MIHPFCQRFYLVLMAWSLFFFPDVARADAIPPTTKTTATRTSVSGTPTRLSPAVGLRDTLDAADVKRIVESARNIPSDRRIPFISGYFLGRKYHPETRKRIKTQRTPLPEKKEASNPLPLPVATLTTSLRFLDCMTYVEHVLALASCDRPDYTGTFLPRLIDIMFDAGGEPLFSHRRNHFTSRWGDVNERKGYLINTARGHPEARTRQVWLNRVGNNRTFYVEDRFMIASEPQTVHYFPVDAILQRRAPLQTGDILALVCDKEGLDVTHMGFFITAGGKAFFRHASLTQNRVVQEDFSAYVLGKKDLKGLMVFRPRLTAPVPPLYRFVTGKNPREPRRQAHRTKNRKKTREAK